MTIVLVSVSFLCILAGLVLGLREMHREEIINFQNRLNYSMLFADRVDERLKSMEDKLDRWLPETPEPREPESSPEDLIPPRYQELLEEIRQMRAQGLSQDEMAARLNMNKGELKLLCNLSGN